MVDNLDKINFVHFTISSIQNTLMTEFISLKYGINIAREDIRKALLILDPEEVERRNTKSLNVEYMSHVV